MSPPGHIRAIMKFSLTYSHTPVPLRLLPLGMQTFFQVKITREPCPPTQEILLVQAVVHSPEWLLGPEEPGLSATELVKILDFFKNFFKTRKFKNRKFGK